MGPLHARPFYPRGPSRPTRPLVRGGPSGLREGALKRVRAYVGLGANLGDAPGTLAAAARALAVLPGVGRVAVSPLYRTRPVGDTDQPDFHNAVVAFDAPAGPGPGTGALALLLALKGLESAFGRRGRERWGPRELDLDLLVFGRHAVRVERPPAVRSAEAGRPDAQWLQVPHPSAAERLFVLAPLSDLAAGLVPPGWTETVGSARRRREALEGEGAVLRVAAWDVPSRTWLDLRSDET